MRLLRSTARRPRPSLASLAGVLLLAVAATAGCGEASDVALEAAPASPSPADTPAVAPSPTVAKPGRPHAQLPARWAVIAEAKPTFEWKKAAGADTYELRVYKGSKLVLKRAGIEKRRWRSTVALPKQVTLAWRVRAVNAAGSGEWSGKNSFTIDPAACFT